METAVPSVDIGSYIARKPGFKGGEPHIAGTGVRVKRIAIWYRLGYTAEEIRHQIEHLTIGQVYAALAYYHANAEEINALIAQEQADHDRLLAEHLVAQSKAA
jgi:uncharacterized protein (DUF433 family)